MTTAVTKKGVNTKVMRYKLQNIEFQNCNCKTFHPTLLIPYYQAVLISTNYWFPRFSSWCLDHIILYSLHLPINLDYKLVWFLSVHKLMKFSYSTDHVGLLIFSLSKESFSQRY